MPVAEIERTLKEVDEAAPAVRMTFDVPAELWDRLMYESKVSHRTPDELLDAVFGRFCVGK